MSDFELGGYSGHDSVLKAIFALIFLVFLAGVTYLVMFPISTPANQELEHQHSIQEQQLFQSVQKTLNDPNVTCQQIQLYRQQHVQIKEWYNDPLGATTNFDLDRDLWNSKNCGVHWGWFES